MNESQFQAMHQLLERLVLALEQIALELPTTPSGLPKQDGAPTSASKTLYGDEGSAQWVCPIHGSWKMVPAGVSKKTGKPYEAFMACPTAFCKERPPRFATLP